MFVCFVNWSSVKKTWIYSGNKSFLINRWTVFFRLRLGVWPISSTDSTFTLHWRVRRRCRRRPLPTTARRPSDTRPRNGSWSTSTKRSLVVVFRRKLLWRRFEMTWKAAVSHRPLAAPCWKCLTLSRCQFHKHFTLVTYSQSRIS